MGGTTTSAGDDDGWQVIRVDAPEPLVDAVASVLADEGAPAAVMETAAPGRAAVTVHVPASQLTAVTDALSRWAASLAVLDPTAADLHVTVDALSAIDWEGLFRHHHRPVRIGRRLLVAPPWDVPDAPDREVLVIEPGMAFGTGQHETTRACLEEIEDAVAGGVVRCALDVGTGSGILAAALARLGVPRVVALDIDAAVLPLARDNLRQNHAATVGLLAGGVEAVRGRFDLVVANLLADTLVAHAAALTALVGTPGRLVASGVLETQAEAVVAAFPELRFTGARSLGSWRTLRFER